jgi:hypothetical protein
MHEYYKRVKECLDEYYASYNMRLPMNTFQRQNFTIASRLLESDCTGDIFINVNARELGTDYEKNYAGFVASITFASVRRRFLLNQHNPVPELVDGDLYYKRYKQGKHIRLNRGNRSILLSEHLKKNKISEFEKVDFGSRLLPIGQYEYNTQNAETAIERYREWLKSAGLIEDDKEMKILNGVTGIDLIICHDVNGLSNLIQGIPYATIGERIEYSSPCEPLVFLSRDGNDTVNERLREGRFENVFFLGDDKYQNGGPWSIQNGYVKRNIYIGSNRPNKQSVTYYRFPNSELQYLFEIPEKRVDISIALDRDEGQAERYKAALRESGLNLRPFSYILLSLRLRTFPMDEETFEDYLRWHRRILNENYISIDGENKQIRDVTELFEELLSVYREGNPMKIGIFQEAINQARTSLIVFVRDPDEVRYASENYLIRNGSRVTTYRASKTAIRSFANDKERARHSLFLFLSYSADYEDVLSLLDGYMLPGKLVFVSDGPMDQRLYTMQRQRNNIETEIAGDICRKTITGIEFEVLVQENIEGGIDDFYGGYPPDLPSRAGQAARYTIVIKENNQRRDYRTGSTCIRRGTLISVEDVIPGDEITLYSSNQESFEQAWRILHVDLVADIDRHSMEWRNYLERLQTVYELDTDFLFRRLQEKGMNVSNNTFLRYIDPGNTVKFPYSSSLRAIENLCKEQFPDESAVITNDFTVIRKADRAYDQTRQELGADLSSGMLCEVLNQQVHSYDKTIKLRTEHPQIFDMIRTTCIRSGEFLEIRIN